MKYILTDVLGIHCFKVMFVKDEDDHRLTNYLHSSNLLGETAAKVDKPVACNSYVFAYSKLWSSWLLANVDLCNDYMADVTYFPYKTSEAIPLSDIRKVNQSDAEAIVVNFVICQCRIATIDPIIEKKFLSKEEKIFKEIMFSDSIIDVKIFGDIGITRYVDVILRNSKSVIDYLTTEQVGKKVPLPNFDKLTSSLVGSDHCFTADHSSIIESIDESLATVEIYDSGNNSSNLFHHAVNGLTKSSATWPGQMAAIVSAPSKKVAGCRLVEEKKSIDSTSGGQNVQHNQFNLVQKMLQDLSYEDSLPAFHKHLIRDQTLLLPQHYLKPILLAIKLPLGMVGEILYYVSKLGAGDGDSAMNICA